MPISYDEYARRMGRDPSVPDQGTQGVEAGWGTRLGAGADDFQAGMYGIGEAAGIPGARGLRLENQVEADANREVANERLAIPTSFRDVDGVGSAARYVGGLAADSAPQLGLMAAGSLLGPAGIAATGYAGALGDTLQNQREQAGYTDMPSAGLAAIPYAAIDTATGLGGAIARRAVAKAGIEALDDIPGLRGRAARAGVVGAREALGEGVGETFQEGMNTAARMGVDSNVEMFSDEANDRYLESFVGGAALGGLMGGVTGSGRSRPARPSIDEAGGKNLLADEATAPAGLQLGYSPLAGTPTVFPDGTVALNGDQELSHRFGTPLDPSAPEQAAPAAPAAPAIQPVLDAVPTPQAPAEPQVSPEQQAHQERIQTIRDQAAQTAATVEARTKRAAEFGLKGTAAVDTFGELEGALKSGLINDAEFAENVGLLTARRGGQVKKFLVGKAETVAAAKAGDEQMKAQALADVQKPKAAAAAPAPAAPATETPAAPAATESSAGQRLVDGLEQQSGKKLSPLARQRMFLWAGLDNDGHPVADKRTLDEVAAIEADRTGKDKAKTRQAINKMLAGFGVNEALIDGFLQRAQSGIENNGVLDGEIDETGDILAPASAAEDTTPRDTEGDRDNATYAEAFESGGEGVNPGMRSVASPNADGIVDPEGSPGLRLKKELKRLAKAKEFSEAQRAQFDRVANIKDDDARHEAAMALTKNKTLFGEAQRDLLAAMFESQRGKRAAEGVRSAVAEQREIDAGVDPELEARNAAQIAENARQDMLALQKAEGVADDTTLEMAVPMEMRDRIDDAIDFWGSYTVDDDLSFDQLTLPQQVAWVKAYVNYDNAQLNDQQITNRYDSLQEEARGQAKREDSNRGTAGQAASTGAQQAREGVSRPVANREAAPAGAGQPAAEAVQAGTREDQRDAQGAEDQVEGTEDADDLDFAPAGGGYDMPASRLVSQVRAVFDPLKVDAVSIGETDDGFVNFGKHAPDGRYYVDGVGNVRFDGKGSWTLGGQEGPSGVRNPEKSGKYDRDNLIEEQQRVLEEVGAPLRDEKFELAGDTRGFETSTRESILDELRGFIPHMTGRVTILNDLDDLPPAQAARIRQLVPEGKHPMGFAVGNKVVLLARNIPKGKARAVYMHEVGGHLGMDLIFAEAQEELADKVREWSARNDDSLESKLAKKALAHVVNAETPEVDEDSEIIAYFLQEAIENGVNPTDMDYRTELGRWMANVVRLMKAAAKRWLDTDQMTAQDMVDMAYGAMQKVVDMDEDFGNAPVKFSMTSDPTSALPPKVAKQVKWVGAEASAYVKNAAKQGVRWGAFTEDLARLGKAVLPTMTKYVELMREGVVQRMRNERNIERVLDSYGKLTQRERGFGEGSVNHFLRESTTKKAWGYKPEYLPEVEVDQEMARRFNAMSASAQAVIRQVFKHGHDTLAEMKAAAMESVVSEHDQAIKAARDAGDEPGLARAMQAKVKAAKQFESLMELNNDKWPYAPLKRFGNHVVIGMSQAYLDAEANRDTKAMREMQQDERHYYVEFAETRREAQRVKERLGGVYAYADNFEKDQAHESLYGGKDTLGAFRRLRTLVEDSGDQQLAANAQSAMNRLMNDLHLTLLSEHSARQSERNRLNVAGADKDMMRAFATQGRATASFIASLRANGKAQDALRDMQREADARKPGREQRRDYYNEMLRRHVMGMDWKPTPAVDFAMQATSTWMLLTSPAYVLTNLTQPFVMSLPVIAGKHGYVRASAALAQAYRELVPIISANKGKFTEDDYAKLPADVRDVVSALSDRGRIDISLEQDLGRWRSAEDSKFRHLADAMTMLRGISTKAEALNRIVTAVAAARLEGGTDLDKRVAYADKIIADTHGDYSGFNSPRFMRQGMGRLMTQFRKFQLIQIALYAKMARGTYEEVFQGKGKDTKWLASKAMAFSLGHMFALGGLLGMPGAQAAGWLLRQIFGDDDEPDDPEATMRKLVGDKHIADLLLKGAPKLLGVDISGRVGAGNMLSLLPFADGDISRKGAESTIVQMMGPFIGGLVPKFADGVNLMANGAYYKGVEQFMPKGVADLMKGTRMATQGITVRNGDVVMKPDEVSVLAGLSQALGLPNNTITDRQVRASSKYKSDEFYNTRTSQVKRQYVEAYRSGDGAALAEARDDWRNLQAHRQANGYKPRPLGDLLKAPREQQKREGRVVGGIQYRKGDEGVAQRMMEE
jgi:hypothetical protein